MLVTGREVEKLRWELTKMLDPADDVLLVPFFEVEETLTVSQRVKSHHTHRRVM